MSDAITKLNHRPEAKDWIALWGRYSRSCDNIIDEGNTDRDSLTESWALANSVYSHPFYRKNSHLLQSACLVATCQWSIANDWERDGELWKRQWADVMRHADGAVLIAACLAGGLSWQETKDIARSVLIDARAEHLAKHGEPK